MFFKSSFGDIYYEVHGPENSMVIAFVHAMIVDHKMFTRQVQELKEQYRVLVWDMPEHGQSVKLDETFSFSTAARCFVELLDELKIEKAVLVGVSMGGYVSQFIADVYPDRVAGLAITGAHPLHLKLSRPMHFVFKITSLLFKILPLSIFKNYITAMTPGDDSKEYIESMFAQVNKRRLLQIFEGLRAQILVGINEPAQVPVLLANGEKEAPLIRKKCAQWLKTNPEIDSVAIPGAGHDAMLSNPEAYTDAIKSFMSRLN